MSSDKSVGQWVGTIVGAVIGYFNPALGWAAGAAIGGAVGGLIDPPKGPTISGPRLEDLSVQSAQFGAPLRRFYGTMGTLGNVIWVENNSIREVVRKKKTGGKGGGGSTVKTYTYLATFAVALGDDEIEGIGRVWINGQLVYNALSDNLETIVASNRSGGVMGGLFSGVSGNGGGVNFRVYTGTDDQMPDPRIESEMGVGNAPAFRGVPYIVFYDLDLTPYGNTLMGAQVKVEVIGTNSSSNRFVKLERFTAADSGLFGRGHCSNVVDPDFRSWVMTDLPTSTEAGTLYSVAVNGRRRESAVTDVATSGTKFSIGGLSNRAHWWLSHDAPPGSDRRLVSDRGSVIIPTGRPRHVADIADTGTYCMYRHNDPLGSDRIAKINTQTLTWTIENTIDPMIGEYGFTAGNGLVVLLSKSDSTTLAVRLYDADLVYIREFSIYYPTYGVNEDIAATVVGNQLFIAANGYNSSITSGTLIVRQIDIDASSFVAEHSISIPTPSGSTITQPQPCLGFSDGVFVFSQREADQLISLYYFQIGAIGGQPAPLSDVVEREMLLSEHIRQEDIDVSLLTSQVRGYGPAGIQQLRNCIGPLQAAYPFDIVPSGYEIKAVPRGASPVASIPIEHLDARPYGETAGIALDESREMDTQLPRKILIRHIDAAREYDVNEQTSPERNGGQSADTGATELALVLTPNEGAGIAEMQLYRQWLERDDIAFRLPPAYSGLEPADIITVDADDVQYELLLRSVQYRPDGILECTAKPNSSSTYTPASVGGQGPIPDGEVALLTASELLMLDIPLVRNEDDQPLFAAAVAGESDSWPGAVLFRSADNEQTWQDIQAFSGPVTLGYGRAPLAAHDGLVIDRSSVLVVDLTAGEFEAITEAQMMTGRNWIAYGADQRWELMRFAGCVLQSDNSYAISILIRGSRGTEWATGLHQQGDAVVLLDDADLAAIGADLQQLNVVLHWRAATIRTDVADAESVAFAYRGVNLRPLSAVHGSAARAGNDWNLSWTRRTRLNGSLWTTGIELPLGEASESWQIDILNGSTVVRTLASTTSSVTYTEAQQIADFGSAQSTVNARTYQMSATVGRGYPLGISA